MENNNLNTENNNLQGKNSFDEMMLANSQKLKIPHKAYMRILKTSLSQSEADINNLEKAITDKIYQNMKEPAHRLKGVYGNLRVENLHKTAESIDHFAKNNCDINEINNKFEILKKDFFDFKNLLSN